MTASVLAVAIRAGDNRNGHDRSIISSSGVAIILLGAGAAVSPVLNHVSAAWVLGFLLAVAGLIEMLAGSRRHETKALAILAGAATFAAGTLLIVNRNTGILPNVTVITAWLLARAVILLLTSRLAHGSVRAFLGIAATTDFVLGAALFVGLSISTLAVTIFGPSPELLASYGVVLALSFLATGLLLLEAASCERNLVQPTS